MHHTSKKKIKKRKKNEVTKKFLQGDSNPDHQNQLEQQVEATSVKADNSSLKQVYIPSLW